MQTNFKYIYGPVSSWRLGKSLGVDLVSGKGKICTFNCTYCQLGDVNIYCKEREIYVPTEIILEEIRSLPPVDIDYITFSGKGEPTLAKNIGEVAQEIKKIRSLPISLLTNSTLLSREDVRKDLALIDFVIAKLDACDEKIFELINKPITGVTLEEIINGLKQFRKEYKNKLGLQIMFIKENIKDAEKLAQLAFEINPDEIQLNTPTRPIKENSLSKQEMDEIKEYFKGLNVVSVFEVKKIGVKPIDEDGVAERRGRSNDK